MTAGLKVSVKTKQKLYEKSLKRPISLGPRYRTYRNLLNRLIKISKNRYYTDKFVNDKGNSKKNMEDN